MRVVVPGARGSCRDPPESTGLGFMRLSTADNVVYCGLTGVSSMSSNSVHECWDAWIFEGDIEFRGVRERRTCWSSIEY